LEEISSLNHNAFIIAGKMMAYIRLSQFCFIDCATSYSVQQSILRRKPVTSAEVAKEFTEMLKANDHEGAAQKFNSPDIVSLEAMEGPMARVQGTAAVKAKSDWWYGAHEIHSATSEGPYINGDQFAVRFHIDVTEKESGKRTQMTEVGLYTVKDGKVVEEKFLY
jgi:SnoaL-like domain